MNSEKLEKLLEYTKLLIDEYTENKNELRRICSLSSNYDYHDSLRLSQSIEAQHDLAHISRTLRAELESIKKSDTFTYLGY